MTVSAGANVGERLMAVGDRHYGRIRETALDWLGRVEIAADRIEEMLLAHPAVKDAGAIAVRGEDGVDVVEAAVVLSAPATPDDIIAHIQKRMPSAAPRRVVIVPAIPRGGDANKVQREDLKRMMMN